MLDIVLSSQKEFVDNVKICEPLRCSDHNQIYLIIEVKGERKRKIRYRKHVHKGRYKDMREYLAKIDWNDTLKNKTANCRTNHHTACDSLFVIRGGNSSVRMERSK